jgi:alpha-1,2-glucosyltransferase
MGGLEAVHAIKTLRPERIDQPVILTLFEQIKYYTWRYSLGDIHDPPLHMLWPDGKFGVSWPIFDMSLTRNQI